MAAAACVSAGVTVGRVVAAADLAALQADAQMQPLASGGQALLAALDRLGQSGDPDVIEMSAGRHLRLSLERRLFFTSQCGNPPEYFTCA